MFFIQRTLLLLLLSPFTSFTFTIPSHIKAPFAISFFIFSQFKLTLNSRGGTMVTYGGMSLKPVTVPSSAFIFNDVNLRVCFLFFLLSLSIYTCILLYGSLWLYFWRYYYFYYYGYLVTLSF